MRPDEQYLLIMRQWIDMIFKMYLLFRYAPYRATLEYEASVDANKTAEKLGRLEAAALAMRNYYGESARPAELDEMIVDVLLVREPKSITRRDDDAPAD